MGKEQKLSFRATPWHIKQLEELRAEGLLSGSPLRSISEVMREALTLLWEYRCQAEPNASDNVGHIRFSKRNIT